MHPSLKIVGIMVGSLAGISCLNAAAADQPLAEITIPACANPPALDGVLNDPAWTQAVASSNFFVFKGDGRTTDRTTAMITADNTWLYIGLKCRHPEPQRLEQRFFRHDDSIHFDESVEIFLDPGTGGELYYHYVLSAFGVQGEKRVTRKGGADLRWDVPWRAATLIGTNGWTAEIAIPLFVLAAHGDLGLLRMNIVRNANVPNIDTQGIKHGDNTEMSQWSPVINGNHEPARFGRVKGLEALKVATPFLPGLEEAAISPFQVSGRVRSYDVQVQLRNHTDQAGEALLTVIDRPTTGPSNMVSQRVTLPGLKPVAVRLSVPVQAMVDRTVQVVLADAATGARLQALTIADTSVLNLLKVMLDRNYYTSEEQALALGRVGLPPADLASLTLAVRGPDNQVLGEIRPIQAETRVQFTAAQLPVGTNALHVELRNAKGETIVRQPLMLLKRPPQPGLEVKIDPVNNVVLKDGQPVFPFGLILYGHRPNTPAYNLDEIFKNVAEAGWNTVMEWALFMRPEEIQPFLELARKHNLWVIHNPPFCASNSLVHLKGELVGDRKTPRAEKSQRFAAVYSNNLPRLIQAIDLAKDFPNLLAYDSFDEPFGPAFFDQYLQGQDLYRRANAADGYHPTFVFYLEKEVVGWADILGTDPYWAPAEKGPRGSPNTVSKWTWLSMQKARQYGMAVWMVPMGELWSGCRKRIVLPAEQLCQTYLALIHGAKGLFYFRYPFYHVDSWAMMARVAEQLKVLGPMVVTPRINQTVTYDPGVFDPEKDQFPDVQAALFRNPAGGYVLLAANSRYYPVDVTFAVSGVETPPGLLSQLFCRRSIKRLFSDQEVRLDQDGFADRLESLGVRAYLLPAETALSEPAAIKITLRAHPESVQPEPCVPASGRPGKKNIAPNPGFEEATVPGWPDYYHPYTEWCSIGPGKTMWGADTNAPFEGRTCLRIEGRNGLAVTLVPQVPDERRYVASVYLKADRTNVMARLIFGREQEVKLTTAWARYAVSCSVTPQVSPYNTMTVTVPGPGTVWADALQIEAGDQPTEFEN